MDSTLWRELWTLAAVIVIAALAGQLAGHPAPFAIAALSGYIAVHLRWLVRIARWLGHPEGEPPEATGLRDDITHLLYRHTRQSARREDQLQTALTRFQDAASAMPDAVVILGKRENIEWANPAAALLIGIDIRRDEGQRIANLVREPEFTRYLELGAFSDPLEMRVADEPGRTVSIQIVPFGAEQRLILARDITRLARLEETRRTFVANVSHELRTPLAVLVGYLDTLPEARLAQDELVVHLGAMREQSARMQRLVEDLLTLSRLETSPPQKKDETVAVPELLDLLVSQARLLSGDRHHEIRLTADRDLSLRGSHEELNSAFSNLINNAVRYTRDRGQIVVSWRRDGDGAMLSVSDTGDGIAPEHLPRLTERFYRVDSARSRASGGTGLGLSIVKHVLIRHDAHLEIDSTIGAGSTFTCIFPSTRVA